MAKNKICISLISQESIGDQMAGSAIRYFELAKALSKFFEVNLFSPGRDKTWENLSKRKRDTLHFLNYDKKSLIIGKLPKAILESSHVISQSLWPQAILKLKKNNTLFIADLYDPLIIETLEYSKSESMSVQNKKYNFFNSLLRLQLSTADHILCASARQRDFYLGIMANCGIINPKVNTEGKNIENTVTILPFGLSNEEADYDKKLVEKKFPAIKFNDKIVFWGGGVWDWFDPMSVVKAIKLIKENRDDIKLLFLGIKHPNPKIKMMDRATEVIKYCEDNGLKDRYVFFNYDWTPYGERISYLKRSSIGISTHFENFETHFSFRTRILDYIGAELPIVCTNGDSFSEIVDKNNLGKVVDYNNVEEIAKAIVKLTDDNRTIELVKSNLESIKQKYDWNNIVVDLVDKVENNIIEARKTNVFTMMKNSLDFYVKWIVKGK